MMSASIGLGKWHAYGAQHRQAGHSVRAWKPLAGVDAARV